MTAPATIALSLPEGSPSYDDFDIARVTREPADAARIIESLATL